MFDNDGHPQMPAVKILQVHPAIPRALYSRGTAHGSLASSLLPPPRYLCLLSLRDYMVHIVII